MNPQDYVKIGVAIAGVIIKHFAPKADPTAVSNGVAGVETAAVNAVTAVTALITAVKTTSPSTGIPAAVVTTPTVA